MKVWGLNIMHYGLPGSSLHGQIRAVVATKSRAAAARAFGVADSFMREYGCETGNEKEIKAAMSKPGAVFVHTQRNETGELVELKSSAGPEGNSRA